MTESEQNTVYNYKYRPDNFVFRVHISQLSTFIEITKNLKFQVFFLFSFLCFFFFFSMVFL